MSNNNSPTSSEQEKKGEGEKKEQNQKQESSSPSSQQQDVDLIHASRFDPQDPKASPVFTRHEESRMTELAAREAAATTQDQEQYALSDVEREELKSLTQKYQAFIEEGERKLKENAPTPHNDSPSGSPGAGGGLLGGFFSNLASNTATFATGAASSIGGAITSVGKGAFFWGTLVGTALPGYVGRHTGLTPDYRHWNWISDKLILGALPVVTQVGSSGNHLKILGQQCMERKITIGLVVACLQQAEMEGFGIKVLEFAQAKHWDQYLGVKNYCHLSMPDHGADVPYESVKFAVDTMYHTMHDMREAVYVHCKAGKGRSWFVVMCYLMSYGGMSFEDARVLVESARYQVSPSSVQVQFAKDFASKFHADRKARNVMLLAGHQKVQEAEQDLEVGKALQQIIKEERKEEEGGGGGTKKGEDEQQQKSKSAASSSSSSSSPEKKAAPSVIDNNILHLKLSATSQPQWNGQQQKSADEKQKDQTDGAVEKKKSKKDIPAPTSDQLEFEDSQEVPAHDIKKES